MAKIAIMGFGTVGSGVLEVCRRNAASIARRAGEPVEVKYILDAGFLRFPGRGAVYKVNRHHPE